jgi:hypothetical protein
VPPTATPVPTVDPDPDRDGVQTWEEKVYGTDPNVVQNWSDFGVVSGVLNNPQRIVHYMQRHLRFIQDSPDVNYFQNAQETFERGGGDCEDSAMFACEILGKNGWSFMGHGWDEAGNWAGAFNVQWVDSDPRGGHAVCVYKASGQPLYYIDNSSSQLGFVRGPFTTLEQVVTDMVARSQGEWQWYEFFDVDWNFGYSRVNRPQ